MKLVDLTVTNTNGPGGYINHMGPVEMLRADFSHNYQDGLYLDTCGSNSWEYCAVNGTVKITDSAFSYNGNIDENLWGLWIYTRNPITINGFSAIGNKGDGLDIDAYGGAVTIKNAVFMNTSAPGEDKEWYGFGLWVYEDSFSNVTLENVVATANANDGLFIGTSGSVILKNVNAYRNAESGLRIAGDITDPVPSARSVNITNSNFFYNDQDNLYVIAFGPITLSGVSTHHSTNAGGAYLDNLSSIYPTPVSITGSSFSDNEGAGLTVYSKGNITLNSITVSTNNSYGVYLDNAFTGATGGITMLATIGVNTIHSNGDDGLQINTTRNITLNKLYVSGSSEAGINVENAGLTTNLILTDVSSWDNDGWGITAEVGGTITWNRGGAWENDSEDVYAAGGAELKNFMTGLPRNITLKDLAFNDNKGNDGLFMASYGSMTLTNINASGNKRHGIYFEAPTGKGGNFTLLRTIPDGYNTFNGNGSAGIYIYTKGNITINRVQANENGTRNAYLDTCQGPGVCQGVGAVTIMGSTSFPVQFNGSQMDDGLFINAASNIKLSGVQVNQNALHGLNAISVNGSVSILGTGNQFNGNGKDPFISGGGAVIDAKGNITLMNFLAEENDWKGVSLNNTSGTGNVTITATVPNFVNRVFNNTVQGVEIFSNGSVLVSKLNVAENDNGGLFIHNEAASLPKPVSVTSSSFISNQVDDGLYISSIGAITINMVTAEWNGSHGAYIGNNYQTATALPITITKSTFNNNGVDGFRANASGNIVLNTVAAMHNGVYGAYLRNYSDPGVGNISVIGKNSFVDNGDTGLRIKSSGTVSISGVEASFNGARGIDIDIAEIDIANAKTVILVNSQALHNYNEGVYSTSVGNTTVKNMAVFLNGAGGSNPGMDIASLNGKIYLYSSTITGNYGIGFELYVTNPTLDYFLSLVNYMGNFGGTYAVYPN